MMTRREFGKLMVGAAGMAAVPGSSILAADGITEPTATAITDPKDLAKPTKAQLAWQEFELGMFIHMDMYVFKKWKYRRQWGKAVPSPKHFNPTKLDTDQWLEAAKSFGAKYSVMVGKHHSGFLQWQSDLYPYTMKQSPYKNGKGDIFEEFVKSCEKYGIKPGVYASTAHNAYQGVMNSKVNRGRGGQHHAGAQKKYALLCEKMIEELCSRYGDLVELWFDGGVRSPSQGGPNLAPILKKHQPNAVAFEGYRGISPNLARWCGNESGVSPYPCWSAITEELYDMRKRPKEKFVGDPDGSLWIPTECDAVLRGRGGAHDWHWVPNRVHTIHTVGELMHMYYSSVGRNSNLLLNSNPNNEGLIPDADMQRYKEFGDEIRKVFGNELAKGSGKGKSLEVKLTKPASVSHVVLMEDIAHGERIREYVVEGLIPGNKWQKLCEGTCVGHKRIEKFQALEVAKVRLTIKKSVGTPLIRKLSVLA